MSQLETTWQNHHRGTPEGTGLVSVIATQTPSPSAPSSFLHFPNKCSSGEHSPIKFLYVNLHLRVSFLESLTFKTQCVIWRDLNFLRQHPETYIRFYKMKKCIHLFLYPLIMIWFKHISLQCLLCSKHCARYSGYRDKRKFSAEIGHSPVKKTNNNHRLW